MTKEKVKITIIDIVFSMLFCLILYVLTFSIRYGDSLKAIISLTDVIRTGGIFFLIYPYLITLSCFMIIRSLMKDSLKTNIVLTAIMLIITLISYYKYAILEQPFIPTDILLIGNIGEIAKFGISLPTLSIILVIVFLILLLVFYYKAMKPYCVENTKVSIKNNIYRIPLFLFGAFILWYMCIAPNRFEKLNIENNLGNCYAWFGGNTTFLLHLGDFYTPAPNGYSKENIDKIKEKNNTQEINNENKKANVIIIMNESFADPNKFKDVQYSVDPLENIKRIAETDANSKIGYLITPVIGGGTSLPEFEVLSGMSSYFLQKQIFPFTSYIKSDMNSIVRSYANEGYKTFGIHPYKENFYNRKNVYKYLGFQKTIFENDIQNPEIRGEYISDNEVANQIIKIFEENEENKFIFSVTMQNHMPYEDKKYNEDEGMEIIANNLTEEEQKEVKNYAIGVHDGDKMFAKLVEYLENIEEPTILMMFGDHIPAFYAGSYKLHEDKITYLDHFTTPYIIWANYDIKFEENISELMSPSSLSLSIMNLANVKIPWYLQEFASMYKEYPAISNYFAIRNDYVMILPEDVEKNKTIENCEILQYDLLIKKKYIEIEK